MMLRFYRIANRALSPAVLRIPCFCGHAPKAGAHLRLRSRCSPKSRGLGETGIATLSAGHQFRLTPGHTPPMSTMMRLVIEFPNRQAQSASPQDTPAPHKRAENRGDLGGIASKPHEGVRLSWGGSANRKQAKGDIPWYASSRTQRHPSPLTSGTTSASR